MKWMKENGFNLFIIIFLLLLSTLFSIVFMHAKHINISDIKIVYIVVSIIYIIFVSYLNYKKAKGYIGKDYFIKNGMKNDFAIIRFYFFNKNKQDIDLNRLQIEGRIIYFICAIVFISIIIVKSL